MFIHEIFKNADPKRLAMTGESNITYGQLEKQWKITGTRCMPWASAAAIR